MNNTTRIFIGLLACVGIMTGVYYFLVKDASRPSERSAVSLPSNDEVPASPDNTEGVTDRRSAVPESAPQPSQGKIKADMFTGILEKVDTGCFADGECYVEVDGKHVTALMGWSRDTVGSVVGVEAFGDLENHVGEMVEVYAKDNSDGTYTLYGSEGFYIKLVATTSTSTKGEVLPL